MTNRLEYPELQHLKMHAFVRNLITHTKKKLNITNLENTIENENFSSVSIKVD